MQIAQPVSASSHIPLPRDCNQFLAFLVGYLAAAPPHGYQGLLSMEIGNIFLNN